jgi:hypothetical protein
MKLTTKKIIAREFLALLLVIVFGLITFLCIYPYNSFIENRINRISNEIKLKSKQVDSLSLNYNYKLEKQNWLFKRWKNNFNISDLKYNTKEKFWNRTDYLEKQDSINYKWKNVWDNNLILFFKNAGFENPDELKAFVKNNRLTEKEILNFGIANKSKSIISNLNKDKENAIKNKFSSIEQLDFSIYSILLTSIFIFAIRYLFYGVKWSMKTLKEKEL